MSTQKRKIGYWGIDFYLPSESKHFFDIELFCGFLAYVDKLTESEKLIRDEKNNKAASLSTIKEEYKSGLHLYKLIFKSCKYNHSPDYMSSTDGSERATDKQLYEGDKELTHACFRIDAKEAFTIFEERRSGVTMNGVIKYFNNLLHSFILKNNIAKDFCFYASVIPSDSFLDALKAAKRISVAEVFVEKSIIGSGYLDLMEADNNFQDDITIQVKSKRNQSLSKLAVHNIFLKLAAEDTKITRVRIYAKNADKTNMVIDSLKGKLTKEITVDLAPNGTVDSCSIFAKIEEMMGVTE